MLVPFKISVSSTVFPVEPQILKSHFCVVGGFGGGEEALKKVSTQPGND